MGWLYYWPFVRWIHELPVDSSHKRSVMQTTFACHGVIMYDLKMENYSDALQMLQHFWQLIKKLIERAATISRIIYMPDSCYRCHWHGNPRITAVFTRTAGYVKLGKNVSSYFTSVDSQDCQLSYSISQNSFIDSCNKISTRVVKVMYPWVVKNNFW